jgi:hypothetical protein
MPPLFSEQLLLPVHSVMSASCWFALHSEPGGMSLSGVALLETALAAYFGTNCVYAVAVVVSHNPQSTVHKRHIYELSVILMQQRWVID